MMYETTLCATKSPLKVTKIKAWTYGYFPFTMGGSPWRPIGCMVKCKGPYYVGRGCQVCVANSMRGFSIVIELTTGAIVGPTLAKVRRDIEEGDPKLMVKQMAKAQEEMKSLTIVPEEEFWDRLENARKRNR